MNRLKYLAAFCLFVILLVGCSSSTQFIYPNTQIPAPKSDGLVLVCKNLNDQRDNKELDKVYTSNPLIDIQKILSNEALNTVCLKPLASLQMNNQKMSIILSRKKLTF